MKHRNILFNILPNNGHRNALSKIEYKSPIWILLIFLVLFSSCKKFVNIDPPISQINRTTVFQDDATATSALVGIYSQMFNSSEFVGGGQGSISLLAGLSSDEFSSYTNSPDIISFNTNALTPTTSTITVSIWKPAYQYIYDANAALEGLQQTNSLTPKVKDQLMGEAKFIRAFCYFYLTNLFGDVPIITSTDYKVNITAYRSSKEKVYQQIVTDLKEAKALLGIDYAFCGNERVRPNKWAATALLARTYLFMGQWNNAEAEASLIINNTGTYSLVSDLNKVFLANSSEAIWQLKPTLPGYNTLEGQVFIFTSTPGIATLMPSLLNSFEPGDQRRTNWVDSMPVNGSNYYFPFKYKIGQIGQPLSEYSMILRLSEQYLIRAEARAQQGNISGAQSDLNRVRSRAGLSDTPANDLAGILNGILHERQIEFFSEWGNRWLDLKRTGTANQILSQEKAGAWQAKDTLYPIPQTERQNDPNLTQNQGY